MNLGLLYWIDRDWLARSVSSFFDLESVIADPDHAYGWAAWNAFLVWVRPHPEFFKLLRTQFKFAVEQAAVVPPKEREREQPFHKLGEHLIFLYAQGKLGLKDEGDLLERFLSVSLPATRSYAIDFAGRIAFENEELPSEVVERLKALWNWYWPNVGSKDTRKDVGARSFGMWFASGKFDAAWSMEELEKSVAVIVVPELDGPVVEELAKIAGTDIVKAMEIVDRLERADAVGDGWHISGWVDDFKKILELALKDGGRPKEIAEAVIDRLGRRGFIEFGALLG